MKSFAKAAALAVAVAATAASPCPAQAPASLPITKVVLFSSGVGYFEHRGAA